MLVIRKEQFDAFRRDEWQQFLGSIAAEARAILASRGDPRAKEPLDEAVKKAVEMAQRYRFRARPHLVRFARLVVVTGPGWQTPAAQAALGDRTATAEARLARLEASVGG